MGTRLSPAPDANPKAGPGLRLRVWLGCLGGGLVAGGGLAFAVTWAERNGMPLAAVLDWQWLSGIVGAGLVAGFLLALWLERGLLASLRGIQRGLGAMSVTELRGLPSVSGWGELSALTLQAQLIIARQRQALRGEEELALMQRALERTRESLERWERTERWEALPAAGGTLGRVHELLNRGIDRGQELREQNREAAEQVHGDVEASLDSARECTEQAERGFVEATALLTTVRELQRLSVELALALESGPPPEEERAVAEAYDRFRIGAAEAIEELVSASSESVAHLSNGLLRVHEVADQVQVLANRATLIALNIAVAARPGAGGAPFEEVGAELKQLVHEVRAATDRTAELSRGVEREVTAADARMRGIRERIAGTLDRVPAMPPAPARPLNEAIRLLDRVREMVQDTTRKGERLSAASERVSRAAERLARQLEEQVRELEGLVVRLAPIEAPEESAQAPSAGQGSGSGHLSAIARVMGEADDAPDDGDGDADARKAKRPS